MCYCLVFDLSNGFGSRCRLPHFTQIRVGSSALDLLKCEHIMMRP